jgi:hypothetical protein
MSKRGAPGAAVEPASKRLTKEVLKKHGVSVESYDRVIEIIQHPVSNNYVAQDERDMMMVAVPHSLCVPLEDRKPSQTDMVDAIGKVMLKINKEMRETLQNKQRTWDSHEERLSSALDWCCRAGKALIEARADTVMLFDAVWERRNNVENNESNACRANSVREMAARVREQAEFDKAMLEGAIQWEFAHLEKGTMGEESDTDKAIMGAMYENMLPLLRKVPHIEPALEAAAKHALLTRATARTPFEEMVVTKIKQALTLQLQMLSGVCDKIPDDVRAFARDRVSLEAAKNAAQVHWHRLQAAEKNMALAKEELGVCQRASKVAAEHRDQQQEEVFKFMEVNMAAFYALECRGHIEYHA